ncbi:unnamed protein product (macronuclear) [Paramecium tetraurelia]|uniref:RNA helicase n=1 Tax=Paramecium tetraurelia TaxID=5888 RepID=A0D315_PARTE|nr:uncharacterized protein GSPATT00012917001 [Paramecium tetraurelia]CAK77432.1 unnamed protein product [Paramecium tetraurelia]|eukprot:XP_001444829.1 hypothetical protein (macronuclear) [Paramecium tetraurelia strain d4-2]
MSNFRQNEIPQYDEFDPDNLDMDDIIKRRWKSKSGKVVGFQKNNGLPSFKKQFLDVKFMLYFQPQQLASQPMPEKVKDFLKANEIAIKAIDGQPCPYPFLTWGGTQFPPQIQNVIDGLNFRAPTPIQSVVFPLILSGYDLIGVAETGSGKTFGYLLPGLIQIKCQNYGSNFRNRINGPEILILAPTRELVMQIAQQVSLFMKPNNLTVATAYGGQNRDQQAQQIKRNPDILVACPGRLKDFLQEGILDLSKVTYLVIDEADRLLDMGFEDDVRFIVQRTRQDRQTVFFSATWPKAVRNLSLDFCAEDPIYVQVGRSNLTVNKNIDQEIICLYNNQKLQTLLDILDQLKINDKVLIFAETRISCEQLSVDMTQEGYYAVALHGNKTQGQRDSIMECYKKGDTKLLCATDLASRGLDVSDITVVINYDFPKYFDDYIHRIGRTGRAGRKGRAISFFAIGKDQPQMARELLKFDKINKMKLDVQTMQDISNGIKLERNTNFQGVAKYGGQIMTHQNNSKFVVPNLSQEEQAKYFLQPHQLENIHSKGRQNHGRQDQPRNNKGYQHNNRNIQEEQFYQNKYQMNNQQRGQQHNPFQNSYRQEEHNNFQGQRRQDYLDDGRNNGRQNFQKNQQPRTGHQDSDYHRNDQKWHSNQQGEQERYYDNRRDHYNPQRGDKSDFQYRQGQQQQGFAPQNRNVWQRESQQNSRPQNPYENDQSYNNQRGYPNNSSRNINYQRDQTRNPYIDDRNQTNRNNHQDQRGYQQPQDQGRGYRGDGQSDNQRSQYNNQRQLDNYDNNNNRNRFPINEQSQQQEKITPPDNYPERNQNYPERNQNYRERNQNYPERNQNYPNQQNTNDRFYQDGRQGNKNFGQQRNLQEPQNNQRFQNESSDYQRENNTRNFNKPQDDIQNIRKDSTQQPGPNIQPDFNNYRPSEELIQSRDMVQDGRDQEINPKILPQSKQGELQHSQHSSFNRLNENFKQPTLEQRQQFAQRQDQNNFVVERFQQQQQWVDMSQNHNQRTLLDQKMDQMISNQDNQAKYDNRQRQVQDNFRLSQPDAQSFNRNERVLDQQDDSENNPDFTRYSRQVDDNRKRFELEQIPKNNQQELNNSRKNSDSQQTMMSEQSKGDSQIQY